jgi:lipoprotein-anchoring transpeptidase ErfK/SrfK
MPHMQRLTWTGIALHAGHLPGYPASHGCVRLPVDFAAKLYSVTNNGTSVIITDDQVCPGRNGGAG